MTIENLKGSRTMTGLLPTTGAPRALGAPGAAGGRVRSWVETVEVTAAATATSTYHMARLPSNARLLPGSVFWDDLASSGSPTMDIGCYPVNTGDFTADPDAINDGMDLATVNTAGKPIVKDPANIGKRLWEFISGVTVDPKCEIDVKFSIEDADCNTGGTATMSLSYTLD